MPVKKVKLQPEHREKQYENSITQIEIERFSITSIDRQIAYHQKKLVSTQVEIDRLTAVKQEAIALG